MSATQTPVFANKVAIVTGAAQGIGWAVACKLAEAGATVALLDKNQTVMSSVMQLHNAYSQKHMARIVDVSDSQRVDAVVQDICQQLGQIDILVNVAGILKMGRVLDISAADWAQSLAVNSSGVFNMSTAIARVMVPQRQGCIITVGSNAATTPRMNMSAYAASKAAAHQFTHCLGLELAQYGIRCNIVSPGSTDTNMQRQLWTSTTDANAVIQGSLADFRLGIPLKRIAQPEDIANAVCFLASDAARHITLHDLRVDGGATLDS